MIFGESQESRETVVKNDKVTERTQEQEWSWERR